MGLSKIWVLAEVAGGKVSAASLELVSAASRFGDEVTAFVVGETGGEVESSLASFGASRLVAISDLDSRLPGSVAAAVMAAKAGGDQPEAIFFSASYEGRDAAGRLSAKLDRPVITNVVNLNPDGGSLVAEHAIFGGSQIALSRFTDNAPAIFVVRPKSFPAEENPRSIATETVTAGDIGAAGAVKVVASHVEERTGPKLDEAPVVVAGGRGLGQSDKFALIEELAALLGGAPGASRAIVDAGWVPYAYQVGQTGKTVKPNLYIACGISGATQHMVGMKGAKNIIAINKDADAPIFSVADLGIVGDVQKVLPAVIEAVKARKG